MADMQITGVSSGIDWGKIIDEQINSRRAIESQWKEEQQKLEDKEVLYKELETYFKDLKSSLDPLTMESTFLNKKAEISVLSGSEDFLSVEAAPDASVDRYEVEVLQVAKNHRVTSDRQDSSSDALGLSGTFGLAIGSFSVSVTVDEGDNLEAVANKINDSVSKAAEEQSIASPIAAEIIDNRLVISSTKTGADYAITATDADGVLKSLGVIDETGEFKNEIQQASNALLNVDGITIERPSNTIDDVFEGVTFDVKYEGKASVDIVLDAEEAVNGVKSMVEAYNAALDWINIRMTEEPVSDPKSDIERRWGLLRGDPLLWGSKQEMRYIVSKPRDGGDGELATLAYLGIETESVDYGKSGKLQFDESKFMEAMLESPEKVKNIMNSFAGELKAFADGKISESPQNVGLTTAKEGEIPNRIDQLERQARAISQRIDALEAQLAMEQAALEALYTNMETRLAELTKMSSYITSLSSLYYPPGGDNS
ncbi:MAG: flagellar filament capping protein FliD [Thermovirga sp.]|nr:flagellar filament capping protein FliD [Thermovirga sp.]